MSSIVRGNFRPINDVEDLCNFYPATLVNFLPDNIKILLGKTYSLALLYDVYLADIR